MRATTARNLVWLARTLGVLGFILSLLGVLWARSDDIKRSHLAGQQAALAQALAQAQADATLPCKQAVDKAHNVLCIVDGELLRLAQKGASARAELRRDLSRSPSPVPTRTTVIVISPNAGPQSTPPGTGRPTPSAARSSHGGGTSPSASPSPSPSPSPSCALPQQLVRRCG